MSDEDLWQAYRAGWSATGEGWNGEYPGILGDLASPPREGVEDYVRKGFEYWQDHR